MLQGLYAAATGMRAIEMRQAVAANNIANVDTPGFKRQETLVKGFYPVLLDRMQRPAWLDHRDGPGGGVAVEQTFSDLTSGFIRRTGDPLHIALAGPGYLAVETPEGERFTRCGKLGIDVTGDLVTPEGYKVQSMTGAPINVAGGRIEIDEDGRVLADGEAVGQLRLVEFEDPRRLVRQGHTLYAAPEDAPRSEATDTRVVAESLEASNVQLPFEMLQMIVGLRAYAANQKVINAFDETMRRLIEQVAAPV